jgi:pSer/pThr/pTyr-binding forkhead associated (FHA) protein
VYIVGTDASCSVVINDSHLNNADFNLVSKKHFKIHHKEDGVYLGGFELTYVNSYKVSPGKKIVLKHNDRIAIANRHLEGR